MQPRTTRTIAGISGTALLAVSAWAFAQAVNDQAVDPLDPVEPYAIQAPVPNDPLNNQPVQTDAQTQALDPQAQDPEPMPGSLPVDTVPQPVVQPTAPLEPAPAVEPSSVTVFAAPPSESEKIERYEAMDSNKDGIISRREFSPGLIDDASLGRIAFERQLARTDGQPMSYSAPVSPSR